MTFHSQYSHPVVHKNDVTLVITRQHVTSIVSSERNCMLPCLQESMCSGFTKQVDDYNSIIDSNMFVKQVQDFDTLIEQSPYDNILMEHTVVFHVARKAGVSM